MKFPESFRRSLPGFESAAGNPYGLFVVPGRNAKGRELCIIATDGTLDEQTDTGWQHVSVSLPCLPKCPSWEEMCLVKDMFWDAEEAVIQFHPPASQYVNNHPGCLHLWRCTHTDFPLPHAGLVGLP